MLGKFTGDPSVAGRMDAFNDAVEKLLWPEKRLDKASIWRTQNECAVHLRKEFVPKPLQGLADKDGYINLGPIPKDTPINLIANLEPDFGQLVVLQAKIAQGIVENSHAESFIGTSHRRIDQDGPGIARGE